MKKSLFGIFAVTAIAMSMVSCNKEVFVSGTVAFSATAPSEASWSGKEKVVFFVDGTPVATVDAVKGDKTDCTAAFTNIPESGTIYAASPYDESESGVMQYLQASWMLPFLQHRLQEMDTQMQMRRFSSAHLTTRAHCLLQRQWQ